MLNKIRSTWGWPVLVLLAVALIVGACSPQPPYATPAPTEGSSTTVTTPSAPATAYPVVPGTPAATGVATETAIAPASSTDPGLLTTLENFSVQNQDNEQIGQVKDLIIDLDTLKIAYVVVDASTYLVTSKSIPVPWRELSLNASPVSGANLDSFSLNITREQLNNAPGFDASNLPAFGQEAPGWDAQFQAFWVNQAGSGYPANPSEASTPTFAFPNNTSTGSLHGIVLASLLNAVNIQTSDGQSLGTLANVVLNIQTGAFEYAVLLNPDNGQWVPVPLPALTWDSQKQILVLSADKATFSAAPSYASDQFPNTQFDGWDADILAYWQQHLQ